MLYLIATPIGNLEDITLRALKVLQESAYILCEDTRRSARLLSFHQIKTPLISFHKFSEKKKETNIINDLLDGKQIALISDAGTPLIHDPGFSLVESCIQQKIPFSSLPGPCSIIQALVLSGFETDPFQYLGFLPKSAQKKKKALLKALFYLGSTVFFESPHRIIQTLTEIDQLDPTREIAILREMTKVHEECLRDIPSNLLTHFQVKPPLGEFVLIIPKKEMTIEQISEDELIDLLQQYHGLSIKDAIKQAAKLLKKPKRNRYLS